LNVFDNSKEKDIVLLLLFSPSRFFFVSYTPCSDIAHMYTRNSCAQEKRKKEKFKVRQRKQVEIYIHLYTCRRAMTICTNRTLVYLLKKRTMNELMEGQIQHIEYEILPYRVIFN
jgi:hypothetical protein